MTKKVDCGKLKIVLYTVNAKLTKQIQLNKYKK